jgi:pimeloyl-ACP methyl ester carboxylesterase
MNSPYQLILLPGVGADHRLLEPQREEFPQLVVPAWIQPVKNESLPEYAARMAATIAPSHDGPLMLGGVSFGGMLAYEMAWHLKPDAVVLIASCRTRQGLRPIYRAGHWLLPLIPVQTWNVAKLLSGPVVRFRLGVPAKQKELAIRMFKEMDSRFMHWALQAILRWEPTPLEGVRIFQIHGGRDALIPARRVNADVVIPDGGHMINVSHAREVNAFIRGVARHQSNMAGEADCSQL